MFHLAVARLVSLLASDGMMATHKVGIAIDTQGWELWWCRLRLKVVYYSGAAVLFPNATQCQTIFVTKVFKYKISLFLACTTVEIEISNIVWQVMH